MCWKVFVLLNKVYNYLIEFPINLPFRDGLEKKIHTSVSFDGNYIICQTSLIVVVECNWKVETKYESLVLCKWFYGVFLPSPVKLTKLFNNLFGNVFLDNIIDTHSVIFLPNEPQ